MTALYKSYANNKKAFGNNSSNNVMLNFNLPREDMGLGNYLKDDFYTTGMIIFIAVGDTLIDDSLTLPIEYCEEAKRIRITPILCISF